MSSTPPAAQAPADNASNSRTLAAVAYILTWLTGLIIFLVAKNDKYARWHAIQAIGLGIAAFVVSFVIGLVGLGVLSFMWWVLVIVAIIWLAVKAYQGEKIRLPLLADWADKAA